MPQRMRHLGSYTEKDVSLNKQQVCSIKDGWERDLAADERLLVEFDSARRVYNGYAIEKFTKPPKRNLRADEFFVEGDHVIWGDNPYVIGYVVKCCSKDGNECVTVEIDDRIYEYIANDLSIIDDDGKVIATYNDANKDFRNQ